MELEEFVFVLLRADTSQVNANLDRVCSEISISIDGISVCIGTPKLFVRLDRLATDVCCSNDMLVSSLFQ